MGKSVFQSKQKIQSPEKDGLYWQYVGVYPPAFCGLLGNSAATFIHRDFTMGESSASLAGIREDLTIIQGLEHGTKGGHFYIHTFLSGVRQIDAKSMPLGNITVDQFAAEATSGRTRFPTLTIGSETGIHGGCQISWTKTGTRVPPIPGPEQLFKKLFVQTDASKKAAKTDQFKLQASILDVVRDEANRVERKLNSQDRQKLDEYLTSIRDVEKRIGMRKNWIDVPKPEAPFPAPKNKNMVEDLPLLYELISLALQTNSTILPRWKSVETTIYWILGIKGLPRILSSWQKQATSRP